MPVTPLLRAGQQYFVRQLVPPRERVVDLDVEVTDRALDLGGAAQTWTAGCQCADIRSGYPSNGRRAAIGIPA